MSQTARLSIGATWRGDGGRPPDVPGSGSVPPVIEERGRHHRVLRRVWQALALWAAVWALLEAVGGMYSWHYFVTGGTLVRDLGSPAGGLHVFASHSELQMGPVTLVGAGIVTLISGPFSAAVGAVLMTGLGLINLRMLLRAAGFARGAPVPPRTILIAGVALVPIWSVLAVHFGHLDDVLAMTFTTAAVAAVARGREWLAPVLLALAVDAKPWAAAFGVLLLVSHTDRARRVGLFLGLTVAIWVPFLLADTGTMRLSSFTIINAPDSALRALGVHAAVTPVWDRPAQLVLGAALAWWCLRSGKWAAVPLAVLAVRMVLDPGTYAYYTASLMLAALFVDLIHRRRLLPWWSLGVGSWFVMSTVLVALHLTATAGQVRAVFLLGIAVGLCIWRPPGHSDADPGRQRGHTAWTSLTETECGRC